MIKIQFKITVEKDKIRRVTKSLKNLLTKVGYNWAIFFSIVILSAAIGLGVRLVLAGQYSNPVNTPPLGNTPEPINIGPENQIKQGDLKVDQLFQKDCTDEHCAWRLHSSGYGYFDTDVYAPTVAVGNNVIAYDALWTYGDVMAKGSVHAPNQGWEDTGGASRQQTPNTAVISCSNGWYLYQVQVSRDGVSSQGWCASPFKKVTPPPPGIEPCFTGKTPVLMADGKYKNIADVQPGEYILTRKSENSSKIVKAKVLGKDEHWVNKYLVINDSLEVTPEHRMFVNGEWKAAGNIKAGDKLLNKDNQQIVVESIEKVVKEERFQVYNLRIEKYQTYFAGEFYVHNSKEFPEPPPL